MSRHEEHAHDGGSTSRLERLLSDNDIRVTEYDDTATGCAPPRTIVCGPSNTTICLPGTCVRTEIIVMLE
ncbi:MAG: hypothetical protein ABI137_15695 [Antricoccus sp.]